MAINVMLYVSSVVYIYIVLMFITLPRTFGGIIFTWEYVTSTSKLHAKVSLRPNPIKTWAKLWTKSQEVLWCLKCVFLLAEFKKIVSAR